MESLIRGVIMHRYRDSNMFIRAEVSTLYILAGGLVLDGYVAQVLWMDGA